MPGVSINKVMLGNVSLVPTAITNYFFQASPLTSNVQQDTVRIACDTNSGFAFTVNLPEISTYGNNYGNLKVLIYDSGYNAETNPFTINTVGSDVIDGLSVEQSNQIVISTNGGCVALTILDNGKWGVENFNQSTIKETFTVTSAQMAGWNAGTPITLKTAPESGEYSYLIKSMMVIKTGEPSQDYIDNFEGADVNNIGIPSFIISAGNYQAYSNPWLSSGLTNETYQQISNDAIVLTTNNAVAYDMGTLQLEITLEYEIVLIQV